MEEHATLYPMEMSLSDGLRNSVLCTNEPGEQDGSMVLYSMVTYVLNSGTVKLFLHSLHMHIIWHHLHNEKIQNPGHMLDILECPRQ